MTCKICGAELLDEDKFCPECGAATEPAATAPAQEIPEVEPAQENVTTTFTPPTPAEPAPAEPIFSAPQPAKKSGGSVFLKIIAILLCLSITIGIAGFFTDWFGFYGPSTKIAKAFTKTSAFLSLSEQLYRVKAYFPFSLLTEERMTFGSSIHTAGP